MFRSMLILSACLFILSAAAPVEAQTSDADRRNDGPAAADVDRYAPGDHDRPGDFDHDVGRSGDRYGEPVQAQGAYEERSYESETRQSDGYRAIEYDGQRRVDAVHRTTDAEGFLTWPGKVDDAGDRRWRDFGPDHGGCPVAHGERVLSCRYIAFEPVVHDRSVAIADEDFADEGSVGPMVPGGGGGGGGGFVETAGSSYASASASAFASASVSGSVRFHGHYGGRHGGGGWGHRGGGMRSGCGCGKK